MTHLSHERSEEEATAFLAAFKARTDGHAPLFTSEKLPAYVAALSAHYSTPEPPPAQPAGVVARATRRDGYWIRPYSMLRWTNGASKDA